MKIVIPKASLNLASNGPSADSLPARIAMLGYSAWVLTDSAIFQHRKSSVWTA